MRISNLLLCFISFGFLLFSSYVFSQQIDSSQTQPVLPEIEIDSTVLQQAVMAEGKWPDEQILPDSIVLQRLNVDWGTTVFMANCAHGHDCCSVHCSCCTQMNRPQVYDTAFSPLRNGVRRITVVERYRYAMISSLTPVYYQFKKENGTWSEKFYPVHYYPEWLDYKHSDKPFAQYSKETEAKYKNENQVLVYAEDSSYQLIDLEGKKVPFKYHSTEKLSDDLRLASVLICNQQVFCLTDNNGNTLSEAKYKLVLPFNKGDFAKVQNLAGQYGLIDRTGREVVPCVYRYLQEIGKNRYQVSKLEHNDYEIINAAGQTITKKRYTYITEYSEGLAVAKDESNHLIVIDMDGKEVMCREEEWSNGFHDGLAGVMIHEGEGGQRVNKWGFIDKTGKLVIDYQFYKVHPFENGAAPVCTGGMNSEVWKVIDRTGKTLSPQTYTNMEPFRNGIAPIIIGGKGSGFIDTNGTELMPCAFASFDNTVDTSWEVNGKIVRYDFRRDSTLEIVDRYGKQLTDLGKYKYAGFIQKSYFTKEVYPYMRVMNYNGMSNLIDENGKELLDRDYTHVYLYPQDVVVGGMGQNGEHQFLIDLKTGKVLMDFGKDRIYDIKNGIITVWKENTYYEYDYYDLTGKKLVAY